MGKKYKSMDLGPSPLIGGYETGSSYVQCPYHPAPGTHLAGHSFSRLGVGKAIPSPGVLNQHRRVVGRPASAVLAVADAEAVQTAFGLQVVHDVRDDRGKLPPGTQSEMPSGSAAAGTVGSRHRAVPFMLTISLWPTSIVFRAMM